MTLFTETISDRVQTESADFIDLSVPDARYARTIDLPTVIEAENLSQLEQHDNLLIVDVRSPEQCVDGHIPGAVLLDYSTLVAKQGSAAGMLPATAQLSRALSSIGLTQDCHVVAYNDDNGSHAARLLWTLDVIGHSGYSLLNGGFAAWDECDLPVVSEPRPPTPTDYHAVVQAHKYADFDYVLGKIGDAGVVLLDTRSPDEYHGRQVRAERGGHIPGAVNFDWTLAIDQIDNGRLLGDDELVGLLDELGVTPDKEIIPYCQTHHRSAHTSFVLNHLGFSRVRAYAGSWSEWGNRSGAPVEL